MSKRPKNSPFQLLVEGPDDQFVVINLLRRHGYDFDDEDAGRVIDSGMPYVRAHGGADGLLTNVGLTVKGGHHCIGVVLDADYPPYDRWTQLSEALSDTGIILPAMPVAGGLILPGSPRFGAWIMPNNACQGMIEDFLVSMVPAGDLIWQHALQATKTARGLKAPLKALHESKGAMHAWLSWQDPSGHPLGRALEYGTLRHDCPEALLFVTWFADLFQVKPTRTI